MSKRTNQVAFIQLNSELGIMDIIPPNSKILTAEVNGSNKYHSDLYRNFIENLINKKE